MAKMNLKSIRFDKEFEVETVKAGSTAVNPEELTIVRFSSLKKILEELGNAVKLETEPIIVPPVVCVKAIITDDTGEKVVVYGSANINAETPIPKKFPVETALSRAVSNAVIEYCQFEGRVYSDVAIPAEEEKVAEKPVQTTPARQTVPLSKATAKPAAKPATKTVAPEDDMPDEAPQEEAPTPAAKKTAKATAPAVSDNLSDYVVTFGNQYTRGKKLSELADKSLEWLAGIQPTTEAAKEAKEKATVYLASRKKELN